MAMTKCPMIYGEEMCLTELEIYDEGTPDEVRRCPTCKAVFTMDGKDIDDTL